MDAKLIIVGGKANTSEIAVRLPAVIGRSRDVDLTLDHPMISRQHCQLYVHEGLVKIRDMGSLNGTLVGQRPIREADLPPGAEFTVGPLTFRIEYASAAAPAPPPDPASNLSFSI